MYREPVFLLVFIVFMAFGQKTHRLNSTDVARDVKPIDSDYEENMDDDMAIIIDAPKSYFVERRELEAASSLRNKKYIPICCDTGLYFRNSTCEANESLPASKIQLPRIYDSNLSASKMQPNDFIPKYGVPQCRNSNEMYPLVPSMEGDNFYLLENGTIFHDYSNSDYENAWYNIGNYCWASAMGKNGSYTIAAVCFDSLDPGIAEEEVKKIFILKPLAMIMSLPFLVATFITYSILPELKTMHGSTLRVYVACLFFAYVGLIIVQLGDDTVSNNLPLCKSIAFVIHFSFLASFFWLNVMCFDIWWTFGGFRSLQGSVRQRERKKFSIYSAYAWGCATLITGICLIMDLVPSVPRTYIRPQFGDVSCWFKSSAAVGIYFYLPMGLTVVCNICLFISTAMKIIQHKKDTAHHLKGMDSRRHDDNKQWFNLYLKLFIVMGINWSMEIISWCFKDNSPGYVWYLTDIANTLQGVIIFVIFVWKDKIKRLLLKRLGCKDRNFQSGNSTRSAYHSSTSKTCTTVMAPLHEKNNPSERTKTTTDESDCV